MSHKVVGQLQGLKASQKDALDRTFRRRVPPTQVATAELVRHLLDISQEMNRRVGALIDRRGHIEAIAVGDAQRVYLPDLGRLRAAGGRFRGVRWVVTQLKHNAALHRDDLVDLQKLRLDYLLSVANKPNGHLVLHGAHLLPSSENNDSPYWLEHADTLDEIDHDDFFSFVSELEEQCVTSLPKARTKKARGAVRAVIISVGTDSKRELDVRSAEMRELCGTAGVEVVDVVMQVRKALDANYVVGRGKLEDIVLGALQLDADLLIFDRELTAAQVRSIADATEQRVIDRTQLILDIFAQHATTVDGKLQVELAQLKYNLPRLSEMSTAMSRLTGGIGGRGPGETKLEINRRRAKEKITQLERAIDKVSMQREVRRKQRNKQRLPIVSIVGYTNAGKSTLLNALTQSDVLVENKLFATLDPTSRRLRFPEAREVIITDTVGFIRELPRDLRNAFRATLEELRDAELLIHVVDASDPEHEDKLASVEEILNDIELGEKPCLVVWNKADLLKPEAIAGRRKRGQIVVSAARREGFEALQEAIERRVFEARHREPDSGYAGIDTGEYD